MPSRLNGKKIAILATDGFEQVELTEPREALDAAGAATFVLSLKGGHIKGWKFKEWGDIVEVDKTIEDANPNDYDALVLPGGVINPDHLRMDPTAVNFVKQFVGTGRPVAAICHGPWTLVEADVVRGKKVTSWPSIKTDLKNAGAEWVDQTVVVDHRLVTSRKPDDLPAFCDKMLEEFAGAR